MSYEKEIDAGDPLDAVELFDLEKDVGEQHNLARSLPNKAGDLYRRFKLWQDRVGAQRMKRNPKYDPAKPTTTDSGVFKSEPTQGPPGGFLDQG